MLPQQLKYMGIDHQAIKNLSKKTPEQVRKEIEKYGVNIKEIEQIKTNNDKILLHIRKIEIRMNNSEKALIDTISQLQKKISELEQEIKQLKQGYLQNTTNTTNNTYGMNTDRVPRKKILNKPIDRNGVAPADVRLEKFFNFSHKRF